ncbi:MAG: prepilin-type N-terminal cleavage/methylation domain-containing protein [Desulfobulbaceae bacterium]|nr:prepilin-type N-terminal cleavage/methylation domain-containing protein [Desulfobulbaceae bacterium]HIJ79895.1 prepilin-type N-terminal cleavage/methylation domain-containing protein [Deltaproteobacteria bacterium]
MDRTLRSKGGFTLLELVIVVCIIGLILSIATANFRRVTRVSSINHDLNFIAAFMQQKRLEAFSQKNPITITVGATQITTAPFFGTVTLENQFIPSAATFTVNNRGLFSPTTGSIRLADMSDGSPNNCIVIDLTRVRMGRWNGAGANCVAD